ncbi:MAG TPA: O-antigen ligase family protein [Chloroflexota bacterium]|nr:O-antigen ligase family protein [Chloroflexota bacterium]
MAALIAPAGVPAHAPEAREAPSPWLMVLPLGVTLALLPPVFIGPLVFAVAGVTVLLTRPRWALYLLALTVPYQGLFDLRYEDVSVSVTEGVVLLLVVAWGTLLLSRRVRPLQMSPLLSSIAALLVSFALTVFVAPNLNLAAKEMLKWVELAAVFVAGTSLIETPRQRRTLLAWLLGSATSQAVVGLAQSFLRQGPEHFMIGGLIMRAYGTFEQPNPFGGYMGLTVPLALSLAAFGLPAGRARRAVVVVVALTGTALALTLSRGAWTAQVVALGVMLSLSSVRARQALAGGSVAAALSLVVLWPLLPAEVTERISSIVVSAVDLGAVKDAVVTPENWAVLERLSQWYAGWTMFLDNPILGVGIGNYNAAYEEYRLDQWPVALGHAHNHYLTIAAESGFLGFLAYVFFWVVVFRACAEAIRRAPGKLERAVVVGILSSFTAFATHNLFDVLFVHGMGVTLGLLLTLLHGAPYGLSERSPAHRAAVG